MTDPNLHKAFIRKNSIGGFYIMIMTEVIIFGVKYKGIGIWPDGTMVFDYIPCTPRPSYKLL